MPGISSSSFRTDDLVTRVIRECARGAGPLHLLERVSTIVRASIPHVAAGWLLVDPETLLINGVHAQAVTRELHLALIEQELARTTSTSSTPSPVATSRRPR